jgi:hypothetical protein
MKTIVLFTDFTPQSTHAARYALHLAKKIKADVLLADATRLRSNVLVLNDGFNDDPDDQLPVKNGKLLNLQTLLETELIGNTMPGKFLPAIYCQSDEATVNEAIINFEENMEIAFVVAAVNAYYGASSIMTDKICGELLVSCKSPMILVPEDAPIRYAEKYAFLADITGNNVPTLARLAKLAEHSAAEIMLVNINTGRPLDADQEKAVKLIMKETVHQIEYGRIYYRHLPNSVLKSDVEWLFQDTRFEMLAMVYNRDSIHKQILRFDYKDKLIGNVNVPLLIYPSDN